MSRFSVNFIVLQQYEQEQHWYEQSNIDRDASSEKGEIEAEKPSSNAVGRNWDLFYPFFFGGGGTQQNKTLYLSKNTK